ncbi:MAG TPA: Jag N-terminal domain-containing protein [Dehalococcoidia bacterium]|nr:Jag N-terminal domain-containing protein [Dehalococcoidia bacterium]
MRDVEASGSNVEEAVRKALDELGVGPEKVEINVLDDGSGPLGEARVRVSASGGEVKSEEETQAELPEDERWQSRSES